MNVKIIEKEAFEIVGKGLRVSMVNGENNPKIPAFWAESDQNGFTAELEKNLGPMGFLGVCTDFNIPEQEFTYYIATEKMTDTIQEDWEVKVVPASTWAIFDSIGPVTRTIQSVWERIFSEWLPTSGYEHADAPELEVYPRGGNTNDENYRCEVWIPIMKK